MMMTSPGYFYIQHVMHTAICVITIACPIIFNVMKSQGIKPSHIDAKWQDFVIGLSHKLPDRNTHLPINNVYSFSVDKDKHEATVSFLAGRNSIKRGSNLILF